MYPPPDGPPPMTIVPRLRRARHRLAVAGLGLIAATVTDVLGEPEALVSGGPAVIALPNPAAGREVGMARQTQFAAREAVRRSRCGPRS